MHVHGKYTLCQDSDTVNNSLINDNDSKLSVKNTNELTIRKYSLFKFLLFCTQNSPGNVTASHENIQLNVPPKKNQNFKMFNCSHIKKDLEIKKEMYPDMLTYYHLQKVPLNLASKKNVWIEFQNHFTLGKKILI